VGDRDGSVERTRPADHGHPRNPGNVAFRAGDGTTSAGAEYGPASKIGYALIPPARPADAKPASAGNALPAGSLMTRKAANGRPVSAA